MSGSSEGSTKKKFHAGSFFAGLVSGVILGVGGTVAYDELTKPHEPSGTSPGLKVAGK